MHIGTKKTYISENLNYLEIGNINIVPFSLITNVASSIYSTIKRTIYNLSIIVWSQFQADPIKGKIVGSAKITRILDGEEFSISIEKSKSKFGKIYRAYLSNNENLNENPDEPERVLIGSVKFQHTNSIFPKDQKYLYINSIESLYRKTFRGIGSALMQAVIEYSKRKQCFGKINLLSTNTALIFYYKLGLRCYSSVDSLIKKELINAKNESREPNTNDLCPQFMELTPRSIKEWDRRIKHNPILHKSQKAAL